MITHSSPGLLSGVGNIKGELTCDQVFFFSGKGEKAPDTFTPRVVCHPLIEASVIIGVIVLDFTGTSSVNCKLIQ